jgi:P-type Ca2+ transporter type 2C
LVAERMLGVTERRVRRFERVAEIPFTSERKRMSTIEKDHEQGDSLVLITKGAPDVLLGRCTRARTGTDVVELIDEIRQQILADVAELSGDALRTLAGPRSVVERLGPRKVGMEAGGLRSHT